MLEKLRSLKLTDMAEAFCEQLVKPMTDLDFETRLGLLIDREWYLRENRRMLNPDKNSLVATTILTNTGDQFRFQIGIAVRFDRNTHLACFVRLP